MRLRKRPAPFSESAAESTLRDDQNRLEIVGVLNIAFKHNANLQGQAAPLEYSSASLCFEDASAFRKWLKSNAGSCCELVVSFHKLAACRSCMSYAESVNEALCFGWIDGVRRRVDDFSYLVRFTPRQASSIWSVVNIAKVHRLRAEGRMTAAGEKAFALRTPARTALYAHMQPSPAELSSSELRALKRNPRAWQFFEATPPGYKKFILHWVTSCKSDITRASRVSKLVQACKREERLR